ncbi:MAG: hypothetical protein WD904_09465 [Dehalococcoidia bacterium]
MPRKYRPPTSRRRKAKKTVEYDFPAGEEAVSEAAVAEDEFEEEAAATVAVSVVARGADSRPERHVNRDYAHVRAEVVRIAIIGGLIIIAVIVGGFFR